MHDPTLTRREVLALLAAAACVPAPDLDDLPPPPASLGDDPFRLGVTCGDPTPTGFVLGTRLAVDPLAPGGGMPPDPVSVGWEVARDRAFEDVVVASWTTVEAAQAHAVHAVIDGLADHEVYFYRFVVGAWTSPVGRARTAPAEGRTVDRLRLAIASCQDFRDGHWTAWQDLVDHEPDLVLFVGDYIYESGGAGVRAHLGGEAEDLEGYRQRYAQYRAEPTLQAAHAVAPWVVTWDDHEVDNDYAGTDPDPAATARRDAAWQAFREHMPVRAPWPPEPGPFRLHRRLGWGTLAELLVLDTRQHRSGPGDHDDPARTMLGAAQRDWAFAQIEGGEAAWAVLVQSLVLSDLSFGGAIVHDDQWDGFAVERRALLEACGRRGGVVVASGDRHASLLGRPFVPGSDDPVAVEVCGNSISSDGDGEPAEIVVKAAWANLDGVDHAQSRYRGWALVDLLPEVAEITFRAVETVLEPGAEVFDLARYRVARGSYALDELS
ncbi:MAG: alkaline phosphatase D family protein [Alphaproteobacteria bacterium]|nr:alkaline phosphatase D family protein [Alphaproteobacteria bacterium]